MTPEEMVKALFETSEGRELIRTKLTNKEDSDGSEILTSCAKASGYETLEALENLRSTLTKLKDEKIKHKAELEEAKNNSSGVDIETNEKYISLKAENESLKSDGTKAFATHKEALVKEHKIEIDEKDSTIANLKKVEVSRTVDDQLSKHLDDVNITDPNKRLLAMSTLKQQVISKISDDGTVSVTMMPDVEGGAEVPIKDKVDMFAKSDMGKILVSPLENSGDGLKGGNGGNGGDKYDPIADLKAQIK